MNKKTNDMQQRLEWIDNIKGIGIFCVLLVHTGYGVFHQPDNIINNFIPWFYMPLFFMAAGFVAYKPLSQMVSARQLFAKKNFNLLIPFFSFGLIFTIMSDYDRNGALTMNPIVSLLTNGMHNGYWFLLFLFVFRYITLIGRFVLQRKTIYKITGCIFLIFIFLGLLCIRHTYIHYIFYLLGMYFSKNMRLFNTLQSKDVITGSIMLLVLTIFFVLEVMDITFSLGFTASIPMMLLFTPCVFVFVSKTKVIKKHGGGNTLLQLYWA